MREIDRITVEHPEMTIGELSELVEAGTERIVRSVHPGNQTLRNLLIITALPPGIEVMEVDSVQGNDPHSQPDKIILDGATIPLCTRKEAKGKIVRSITISKIGEEQGGDPRVNELVVTPCLGETLTEFHARALDRLYPHNPPIAMSQRFAQRLDILQAAMCCAIETGEAQRTAEPDGTIIPVSVQTARHKGIFGIEDNSPTNEGLLPSLVTMMALDIATSALVHRTERTIHLGGEDMARYTRDPKVMNKVVALALRIAAELEEGIDEHSYQIVDIRGLNRLVSSATHASQHQLLRAGDIVNVDLEKYEHMPCGNAVMARCS